MVSFMSVRDLFRCLRQTWLRHAGRDDPELQFDYGCQSEAAGDISEAIFHYSLAIDLDPRHHYAFVNRGMCFYQLRGNHDAAARDLRKAVSLRPYEEDAVVCLAEFLLDEENPTHFVGEALRLCREFALRPERASAPILILQARAASRSGYWDEAASTQADAVERALEEPWLHNAEMLRADLEHYERMAMATGTNQGPHGD